MTLLSMLGENVAIICIERNGPLPLSRCVSRVRLLISSYLTLDIGHRNDTFLLQKAALVLLKNVFNKVRVNSPAPPAPTSQQLRRSQSAVVGSRESEERGEERASRREEKRREGDPLEEVRRTFLF